MKKIVLCIICMACLNCVKSQNSNNLKRDSISAIVEKEAKVFMNTRGAVGVSVGLLNKDRLYTYNFGSIQKDTLKKPTENTFYPIASITKTFTGLLLAMAVTENKVKLDDDIRIYLDGDYPNLQYDGHPIKLYHLISHVSRLPFFLSDRAEKPGYTRADFYEDLHKVKLDTLPGIKFKYSNAAAQLLGYILEKVYNKSYEELLEMKIAHPLKLQNTLITLTSVDKRNMVKGYNEDGSYNPELYNYMQAAGGIKSTIKDLLNYITRQMNEKDSAVLLSHKESWGFDMGNDVRYSFSLGWQIVKNKNGLHKIFQDGNLANNSSVIILCPELKSGIVVLSNVYMPDAVSKLANDILKQVESRIP